MTHSYLTYYPSFIFFMLPFNCHTRPGTLPPIYLALHPPYIVGKAPIHIWHITPPSIFGILLFNCLTRPDTSPFIYLSLYPPFIFGTGPIHIWQITHSFATHVTFICGTEPFHTWEKTPSYVGHDSFICGTLLIYFVNDSFTYDCQESGLLRADVTSSSILIFLCHLNFCDTCVCLYI